MKHYSFKDGVIQEHLGWEAAVQRGASTFVYSPKDEAVYQWTQIVPSTDPRRLNWQRRTK